MRPLEEEVVGKRKHHSSEGGSDDAEAGQLSENVLRALAILCVDTESRNRVLE